MRFLTDFVPGDEQREQVLRRHFSMLPKSARRDSVLCLGQMTLHFRHLSAPPEEPGMSTASAAGSDAVGRAGGKAESATGLSGSRIWRKLKAKKQHHQNGPVQGGGEETR